MDFDIDFLKKELNILKQNNPKDETQDDNQDQFIENEQEFEENINDSERYTYHQQGSINQKQSLTDEDNQSLQFDPQIQYSQNIQKEINVVEIKNDFLFGKSAQEMNDLFEQTKTQLQKVQQENEDLKQEIHVLKQNAQINRNFNILEIIKIINDDDESEENQIQTLERMSMLVLAKSQTRKQGKNTKDLLSEVINENFKDTINLYEKSILKYQEVLKEAKSSLRNAINENYYNLNYCIDQTDVICEIYKNPSLITNMKEEIINDKLSVLVDKQQKFKERQKNKLETLQQFEENIKFHQNDIDQLQIFQQTKEFDLGQNQPKELSQQISFQKQTNFNDEFLITDFDNNESQEEINE